jgi:hypothetical protein
VLGAFQFKFSGVQEARYIACTVCVCTSHHCRRHIYFWAMFSSIWTWLMVYLVVQSPDPCSASTVQQQLQCHSVLRTQAV